MGQNVLETEMDPSRNIPVCRDPHQLGMSFQFKLKRAGNASFLLWNLGAFYHPGEKIHVVAPKRIGSLVYLVIKIEASIPSLVKVNPGC